MRKRLSILGLVVAVGIGPSSLAGLLAGHLPASTLSALSPDGVSIFSKSTASSASARLAADDSGNAIVQYAMKYLGYAYTTTGNSPSTGFSCIGFVSYVYRSLGINLPDDLGGAMAFAQPVAFSNLQPGDILYFQNTVWSGLSHVAIYIGGGRFIHAEWYNRGVVISSFTNDPVDDNYWESHYLGANRPWAGSPGATAASPPAARPISPATSYPRARAVRVGPSGPTAVVRVAGLNVRSRPSIRSALYTVASQGTRTVILGRWRNWYRVALPGKTVGWVIGAGIGRGTARRPGASRGGRSASAGPLLNGRIGSISRQLLRPRSARRARYGSGALARPMNRVLRSSASLNVRAGASLSSPILSLLVPGESYRVLGWSSGWAHVRLSGGTSGWISGSVLGGGGSTPRVSSRRATGVRRASGAGAVSIAQATLNLRQGPSLGAAILSIVPPGASYRILGWSAGWAHVRLAGGTTGWIYGGVLGTASSAPGSSSARRRRTAAQGGSAASAGPIVTATIRVHARPGLGSAAIGLVAAGTHVQVLSYSAGWTKVRLPDGQVGYILGSYVKA